MPRRKSIFAYLLGYESDDSEWGIVDVFEAVDNPNIPVSLIGYHTVKIIAGPNAQKFIIPEALFQKYIRNLPGFVYEFSMREFYGIHKTFALPFEDPETVEVLVKRMYGNKNIYNDQFLSGGVHRPIHEMNCFKIFMLAAKLNIPEFAIEALEKVVESLEGGKWPVTKEAVVAAYRSVDDYMEALQDRLIVGVMEEYFAGGGARRGRPEALEVDASFDREFDIAVGYHLMIDECELETCYYHKSEEKICEVIAMILSF